MSIEPMIERVLQRTQGLSFCADCLTDAARLSPSGVGGRLRSLMHRARVAALVATTFRRFTDRVVTEGVCDQCGGKRLVVRKLITSSPESHIGPRTRV